MDTKYFYVKNNEPVGPLTLEELLKKDISSKTYVWRKGMEKWVMAENMPELYKALQLKKENPPHFPKEDTIEYKEEKPPHFQKEDTTHFQKEDKIQQKEENPPQTKEEKRNQILNSVLLVIVLIAGLGLTAFAFFGDYGDFFPIFIFGYGMIGAFGYSIAEKLRLGDIYLYFIYTLIGVFFVGGIILTVGGIILTVFDWGIDLSLPNFIQDLYKLWLILVFLAIILFIIAYISDKINLTIEEFFSYGISILISLFFIGGILLFIWDWATSFRLSRNPGFVKDYEGLWGIIVFGFLLIAFIITIFKTFKWFIIWISGKTNDLLNKNLIKTKWFLITGCLILGLTAGYIQIKNVKLRAENKNLSSNIHTIVKIGTQYWSARNLNVTKFRNGDIITETRTEEDWKKANQNGTPAWCFYDYDPENGEKYGRLYNWHAVNDARGLAPKGYHIPTDHEFTQLKDFLGFSPEKKIKSKNGWKGLNGTDQYGFTALPGGYSWLFLFDRVGYNAYFWTSDSFGYFLVNSSNFNRGTDSNIYGMSVRCIMD